MIVQATCLPFKPDRSSQFGKSSNHFLSCDTQMGTISFDRNCYRKIEIPRLFLCCNQLGSVTALYFDKIILYAHEIFELTDVLNGD